MSNTDAHKKLKGSFSKDKHEMMFERGINYNDIEEIWRKGSVLIRMVDPKKSKKEAKKEAKKEYKK